MVREWDWSAYKIAGQFLALMTDQMQYLLACLLTHTTFLKCAMGDERFLYALFDLSEPDKIDLKAFLKHCGRRAFVTACLMEEKRYREMTVVLKYIPTLIDPALLKHDWYQYLSEFSIHYIPETPLVESIYFLKYLLNIYHDFILLHAVIQYELAMKRVSMHVFSDYESARPAISSCRHHERSYIVLNKSLLKQTFDIPVMKIISNLKQNNQSKMPQSHIDFQREEIFFYQSKQTRLVKAVLPNQPIRIFLDYLIEKQFVFNCNRCITQLFSFNCDVGSRIIKHMVACDLISIIDQREAV
ncbi:MAG: hypothetical protein ACD_46C00237G0002 [uncultured bacterium]|nr:MAG: hypothetical protein ACD_46C00237G0002 [uncultured bacterium]